MAECRNSISTNFSWYARDEALHIIQTFPPKTVKTNKHLIKEVSLGSMPCFMVIDGTKSEMDDALFESI